MGSSPTRDHAIDALRTVAILLMAASHVARTIYKGDRSPWFDWVVDLDPYAQGLFLCLVGVSLVLSFERSGRDSPGIWYRHHLRRGLEIYAIGVLLFFLDHGWQWPDTLVNPGILSVIGLGIFALAPLVMWPKLTLWLGLGFTIASAALLTWLDQSGQMWFVINHGNAPLLPNLVLSGFGIVCGVALCRDVPWLRWALGLGAVAAVGISAWFAHPIDLLTEPLGRTSSDMVYLGRSHGLENAWDLLNGRTLEPKTASYFNPRITGTPLVLAMIIGTYALFRCIHGPLSRVSKWLLAPGRYSLGVYVFHLLLVILPVLVGGRGRPFREGWQGDLWFCVVLAFCYAYAWGRMWMDQRKRGRAA